jgi:hypothetical protein
VTLAPASYRCCTALLSQTFIANAAGTLAGIEVSTGAAPAAQLELFDGAQSLGVVQAALTLDDCCSARPLDPVLRSGNYFDLRSLAVQVTPGRALRFQLVVAGAEIPVRDSPAGDAGQVEARDGVAVAGRSLAFRAWIQP